MDSWDRPGTSIRKYRSNWSASWRRNCPNVSSKTQARLARLRASVIAVLAARCRISVLSRRARLTGLPRVGSTQIMHTTSLSSADPLG